MVRPFAFLAVLAWPSLSLSLPTTCEDAAYASWTGHSNRDSMCEASSSCPDNTAIDSPISVRVTSSAPERVSTGSSHDPQTDPASSNTLIESKGPPLFIPAPSPSSSGPQSALPPAQGEALSGLDPDGSTTSEGLSPPSSPTDSSYPTEDLPSDTPDISPTTTEGPETTGSDPSTSRYPAPTSLAPPQNTDVIDPAAADAWPDDACRFELKQESTTHEEPAHLITTMNLYREGSTTPMYEESGLQFWFQDKTLEVNFAKAETGLDSHLNLTFPQNEDGEYNEEYPEYWSIYDGGPSWRRWGVALKYGDVEWESTQTDKGQEAWCDNYPWFENPTVGSEYLEFRLMNCFFPCGG